MFYPDKIARFRFVSRSFDAPSGIARLVYAFDECFTFTEEFRFHGAPQALDPEQNALVERLLLFLHLAAGVSYYKAAIPTEIVLDSGSLSRASARFFEKLYLYGLGEFAFRNQISLNGRIRFPHGAEDSFGLVAGAGPKASAKSGLLVPLGGGKDSLVTVEILRSLGVPLATYVLGDFPAIENVAAATGVPLIKVSRKLDPLLMQLNREGAYNGHVPISSIFSFSALLAGVLHGYSTVVASQERSANSGNVEYDGIRINHQYSKSFEFERDLSELLRTEISPKIRHFSLLRPLSEVHIAKLFAKLNRYHQVFTSCNTSFRLSSSGERRWCGNCPKCRFVFLSLAPFLQKPELLGILGKDLLEEPEQIQGFRDLLGLGEMKPFECVGEFDEARWCVFEILNSPDWRQSKILQQLARELQEQGKVSAGIQQLADSQSNLAREIFEFSREHELPSEFEKALHEFAVA